MKKIISENTISGRRFPICINVIALQILIRGNFFTQITHMINTEIFVFQILFPAYIFSCYSVIFGFMIKENKAKYPSQLTFFYSILVDLVKFC